ncbi:MAG: CDP-alcohol phosphatidyltransferase family protein [Desulfobacteraceae bacterium]|nr:MAG: CDP-alcohol phosphatidyltransferase family protein [Desulfobacteraceae bacterium]
MSEIFFLGIKNRDRYLKFVTPVGDLFARAGIHPHVLTAAGFVFSLLAGVVYGGGYFFWGACLLVLAGVCDTLDGQIARKTKKQSLFGAFFDSTLDRYSDLFPFAGMAYYFSGGGPSGNSPGSPANPMIILAIIMTIAGSFMVSYTRARAEGLGVECKKGIMQRPERITFLIIGSFLGAIPLVGPVVLKITLVVLAILTNATAVSRIIFTRRELSAGKGGM